MSKDKATSEATSEATSAVATVQEYAVMQSEPGQLAEMIATNLGGSSVSAFDLDTIKTPAGGGTSFVVPGLDGETEAKELRGVLVGFKDTRSYWREGFDESGGGTPPDCSSQDMIRGEGDPGGLCSRCSLNRFGSAAKGNGKACSERRLLFLVRESDLLPIVISVPPSGIREARKFFLRLLSQRTPYYAVIVRLTLARDKNRDGIAFSRIVLDTAGRLPEAEAEKMRAYAESLRPVIERAQVAEDVEAA